MKINFTRTRTVASVTAGLTSLVTDLEAVTEEQEAEATRQDAAMLEARAKRDAAIDEASKAKTVAAKIESLLS